MGLRQIGGEERRDAPRLVVLLDIPMVLEARPVPIVKQPAERRPALLRDALKGTHRHQVVHQRRVQLRPGRGLVQAFDDGWGEDGEPGVHLRGAVGGVRAVFFEGVVGFFGEDDVEVGLVALAARCCEACWG